MRCHEDIAGTLTMKSTVVALLLVCLALVESRPNLGAKDLLPFLDGPVIPELGKFVAGEVREVL